MRIDRIYNAFKQFTYGSKVPTTRTVYAINVFDGAGRVQLSAHYAPVPGAAGTRYSGQKLVYDVLGRVIEQSNPTEMSPGWVATGDDAAGWVSSFQTYDWKGRVKRMTNADGTSTENTYAGCGCVGGEVAEIGDEVGRRQHVILDVPGCSLDKPGNVYMVTPYTYNARNQIINPRQVTNLKQYQGTDQKSSVYQDTVMTYDGYGRLSSRRLPQQSSSIIYSYYTDDLVQSVQDARGAVASYSYNARHLLMALSYSVPVGSNMAANAAAGYSYDAAGNRISMTDGMGSTNYHYDQLSRMDWEERKFTGATGAFRVCYAYNIASRFNFTTDPLCGISYSYNPVGRTTELDGTSVETGSKLTSNMRYRAWGALKSLSYSNLRSLSLSYNARMQTTYFEAPGVRASDSTIWGNTSLRTTTHWMRDLILTIATMLWGDWHVVDGGGRLYDQSYSYEVWGNLTINTGDTLT